MPYLSRSSTKPVTLNIGQNNGPVTLKERLEIIIPIYSIHYNPKYFPNPEKFDPNRFTPENIAKRHSCTFLPFGDGPRQCLGKYFRKLIESFIQAKLICLFQEKNLL